MHIYFMGIGGTAMGTVAILLKQQNYKVSGSDQNLYPPMSDQLIQSKVEVYSGYDEERLQSLRPDLVVVGNVIGRGNPEAEWLLEQRKIPFISLPQLIGEKLIGNRHSIVVSGTHGKTTTTALTTHLLKGIGTDPGYLIAGVQNCSEPSSAFGNSNAPFVIEGDEYDCAFFDKRSKFIHYLPRILIINNLEFDHGDIFRDFQDIQRSFSHVVRLVPQKGHILINGDDEKLSNWVTDESHSHVWRVGFKEHNDCRITAFEEHASGSKFTLVLKGQKWMRVEWSLAASYNARNAAMAALSCALQTYPDAPEIFKSEHFQTFKGIKRRQQILLETKNRIVIEDFGHHPTAIRETISSYRTRYPKHKVWCAFEPRSNTSRSPAFQHIWPDAFAEAERVWIGAIHRIHLLQPNQRLSTEILSKDLHKKGCNASAHTENEDLFFNLQQSILEEPQPIVLLFFSNGSFDGIIQRTVETIKENNRS